MSKVVQVGIACSATALCFLVISSKLTFDIDWVNYNETCSLPLFQQYFMRQRQFPERGSWLPHKGSLRLDFCEFKSIDFLACLQNAKYILLTGDSQGIRYFNAAVSLIEKHSARCTVVKTEHKNSLPYYDLKYYGNNNSSRTFTTLQRTCRKCLASKQRCTIKYPKTHVTHAFIFEYLGGDSFEFLQFALNHYLTERPDIYIFIPHMSHVMTRNIQDIYKISNFATAKHSKETKLVVIPCAATFPAKRRISDEGLNTKMYLKNLVLYDALEGYFRDADASNVHGFVNLYNVTENKEEWSEDGIHFTPDYYETIMNALFSTICNT